MMDAENRNVENLIERMKAISNVTVNARRNALAKIKELSPRINKITELINAAEKNGIPVKNLRKDSKDLFPGFFSVRDSYLAFKNEDCGVKTTDDAEYYIDHVGDVYTSTYAGEYGKVFEFNDTFKLGGGSPENEERNMKILRRLNRIINSFDDFENSVYSYIENEIIKREENK